MVVLYPQTSTAATNSCWDWFGYDSPDYAKKSGPQMVAIKAMVNQVSGGTTPPVTPTLVAPTGVTTSNATASGMQISWNGVTNAASYNVYHNANKTYAMPVTGVTFNDTGLAAATQYSWTVKAVDANNVESAASAAASGTTTGTAPPAVRCYTATNYAHKTVGRAYAAHGYTYAYGSNQNISSVRLKSEQIQLVSAGRPFCCACAGLQGA